MAANALVAVRRIEPFLLAEELGEPYTLDPTAQLGVFAEGDFAWDGYSEDTAPESAKVDLKGDGCCREKSEQRTQQEGKMEMEKNGGREGPAIRKLSQAMFELRDVKFAVPRLVVWVAWILVI